MLNMILKDGTRSKNPFIGYKGVLQSYDYFLPPNNRITAVTIYYKYFIDGLRFHLSDGSEWDIGYGFDYCDGLVFETETVDIADNEVIVGFNSKSHPRYIAIYAEIQFLTMRKPN